MRIAIVLSGSIRNPEKSLASIKMFDGHEVSVFLHTWENSHWLQPDSFSKLPNVEPDGQLIAKYNPVADCYDDWLKVRPKFIDDLRLLKEMVPELPRNVNNIGFYGMFYSLARAYEALCCRVQDFDLIVRMRFDCLLVEDMLKITRVNGWNIPEGFDFFGLNDQLAWFWTYPDSIQSRTELAAYFGVYDHIRPIVMSGIQHGPEVVLKANFDRLNVPVNRPKFSYSIH